jgi:hypothetical protein
MIHQRFSIFFGRNAALRLSRILDFPYSALLVVTSCSATFSKLT